jgi:hypothetical protein
VIDGIALELNAVKAHGKIYFSQQEHMAKLVIATRRRVHRNWNGKFSSSNFAYKNGGGNKVVTTVSKVNTMRVMMSRTVNK